MLLGGVEFSKSGFYLGYSQDSNPKTENMQKTVHQSIWKGIGETLSSVKKWAFQRISDYFSEPSLYMSAKEDETFKQFVLWHQEIASSFKSLTAKLEIHRNFKDESLVDLFQDEVMHFWNGCDRISSPAVFAFEIEKLARAAATRGKKIQGMIEDLRNAFLDGLKNTPNITQIFLDDLSYLLVLLSAEKISREELFSLISLYEGILDKEDYERAFSRIGQFVEGEITKQSYLRLMRALKANQKESFRVGYNAYQFIQRHPYVSAGLMMLLGFRSYASAQPFAPIFDVSSLNGTTGFSIMGLTYPAYLGWGRSSAGDFNADGFKDLLVCGGNGSYVIYGPTTYISATFGLNTLNGKNGFSIQNPCCFCVATVSGDFNGDKIDDFALGYGSDPGQVAVLFGSRTPFPASIDLPTYPLNGKNGFMMNGILSGDGLGIALGKVDFNHDGIDDLIASAPYAPNNEEQNQAGPGQVYVFLGSRLPYQPSFTPAILNGTNGFTVMSQSSFEGFGNAVGGADLNHDQYGDLFIGNSVMNKGFVFFGFKGPYGANYAVDNLNGQNGFNLVGAPSGRLGCSIGAGDINGDGIKDLLIGDEVVLYKGKGYAVFGSEKPFLASLNVEALDGTDGIIMVGEDNDSAGYGIDCADIDGDQIDDPLIGAPGAGDQLGKTYVFYGSRTYPSTPISLGNLNGRDGFTITSVNTYGQMGTNIGHGDITGDGLEDLFISAPRAVNNHGQVYAVYGRKSLPPNSSSSGSDSKTIFIWVSVAGGGVICIAVLSALYYLRKRRERSNEQKPLLADPSHGVNAS